MNWTVSELNPGGYILLRNQGQIANGTYESGEFIIVNIDGLSRGVYNFTIIITDESGLNIISTNWITVQDKTLPGFIGDPYFDASEYIEGDTGYSIKWVAIDKFNDSDIRGGTYIVYRNNTEITNNTWDPNDLIDIGIDGLAKGNYNFTILLIDESNNFLNFTFFIDVIDTTNPVFNATPGPQTVIEGTTGNSVGWNASDLYPGNFTVYQNDILIFEGIWDGTNNITYSLDGLNSGEYNYTITVSDLSGNKLNDTINVIVIDTTKPVFNEYPESEVTIDEGTNGNYLSWNVSDKHPDTFIIMRDGLIIDSGSWTDGELLRINVDQLQPKFYDYTIIIYDEANNEANNTVKLRIKDPSITDTEVPSLDITTNIYEGDFELLNGTWITDDGELIDEGRVTISLINKAQESVVNDEFSVVNGYFQIQLNYTDIPFGDYDWFITLSKDGYQSQTGETTVTVLPHNYEIEIQVFGELIQGEEYFISAIVNYANEPNNTSFLALNEISSRNGPTSDIEVLFTIHLVYRDGSETTITKSGFSNEFGVAIISLSAAETDSLAAITNIDARILGNEFSKGSSATLFDNELPNILGPNPGIFSLLGDNANDYSVIIIIIIVIGIASVYILFALRRKKHDKISKLNRSIKAAQTELTAILSIQSIVIQTTTKLTIYEEELSGIELNTSLIGGMVSAFSTFLNEIGSEKMFGFEMMEREGVSITSHKGKISNFIVISKGKLPLIILDQIVLAQKSIEKSHKSNFTKTARGVKRLKKSDIRPLFDKAGFKISIIGDYKFNEKNLKKLMKEGSISNNMKQNIKSLSEFNDSLQGTDIKLSFDSVFNYFRSREMSAKMSARAIILTNLYHVLASIDEN